ncbi:beta-N-acetylhexosaminidase [Paracoccus pantotrophus]|uniref:Beta-N-acetylhexosaminidase n=1 Tax=Paracoccus pantotrophus TaxID=82367 RepID=A0AAE6TRV7_PARPN|nr:glycoside hydrolase family 3 N-terminal domain-containing protein [Paracoccus pantotrophus]MDF3856140.1 glycoside hydrolase family 3 N-terminal domain-containing protein [Paracoccus pantotrophus]QFG34828.1 glycoside hydrolase [Paracoccus pantotrophus]RKS43595.1 beta-N-acetylhexosaminidase [Paracoccus pantotrophus]SFP01135.1 beta-N-acetylhexosaminidase [Paracoccus pantotrophus]
MCLEADAHAVLLPAIDDLMLTDPMARFLDQGGRALLIGETRAEYVARRMSDARCRGESADKLRALTDRITGLAGPALVALDQEPSGIRRLHGLVPQLPDNQVLYAMASEEIERVAFRMAQAARGMGVTMFLSPVIDVVTGRNPWLQGRTLGTDAAEVARIGCAFIRGVEAAGVVATAKHFPGHHDIDGDPAVDAATVSGGADALAPGMVPFRAAIAAGVRAAMTGPSLVPGMDAVMPSSLSATTIAALRGLGFTGMVVSDDLDAIGTLRGQRDVPTAAVEALRAGSDLLLLSAANDLEQVRTRILSAVAEGSLPEERLTEAAVRVRALAGSMG